MTENEFALLSEDLKRLAASMPLEWGEVQNDSMDNLTDIFRIKSYGELERFVAPYADSTKDYARRRWYLYKCSECDKHLMANSGSATPVSLGGSRNSGHNITIGGYDFGMYCTVVPRLFADNRIESLLARQEDIIDSYYDRQSKESRNKIQNRLFVIHHSLIDGSREMVLRSAWNAKRVLYRKFCDSISDIRFYETHGVIAGTIFLIEKELGKVKGVIYGLDNKNSKDNESDCDRRHTRSQELEGADRHECSECVCRGLF